MGRVRLCRKTPLFVSLLLLFLSLLPAPPTPSPPSRLSLFLSNHLIQTSRTLHTKKKNADELADNTTYFSSSDKTAVPAAPNPRPPFISEKPFPLILCLRQLLFLHPLHASATPSEFSSFVFFCFFFLPPFPVLPFLFGQKHARSHTSDLSLFLVRTREPYRLRWVSVRGRRLGELTIVRARASCSRTGRAAGDKGGSRFRFFSSRLVLPPKAVPSFS
jgi:hypothetical protein